MCSCSAIIIPWPSPYLRKWRDISFSPPLSSCIKVKDWAAQPDFYFLWLPYVVVPQAYWHTRDWDYRWKICWKLCKSQGARIHLFPPKIQICLSFLFLFLRFEIHSQISQPSLETHIPKPIELWIITVQKCFKGICCTFYHLAIRPDTVAIQRFVLSSMVRAGLKVL